MDGWTRRELRAALAPQDAADLDLATTSDAELLLRAYLTWGEDCPRRVLGDFAFAIWDGRQRTLFCARDPFGLKLLYYAQVGGRLVVSNTLNCIRQHPLVSNRLNERALGDFLLFRVNQDLDTTVFADVQRVPGGHTLQARDALVRVRPYHRAPMRDTVRYRRASEYVDHFRSVMDRAVADRLRTNKMMILMTGGMDSTTIAATALDAAAGMSRPLDLLALTGVFGRLMPGDQEGHYAGVVAAALGLPIEHIAVESLPLYESWRRPDLQTPEPSYYLFSLKAFGAHYPLDPRRRVVLFGHGSDLAFQTFRPGVVQLLTALSPAAAGLDLAHSIHPVGHLPPLGLGLRRRLNGLHRRPPRGVDFPAWVKGDFARRLNLRDRWEQALASPVTTTHTMHYGTYDEFRSPSEATIHEWWDPSGSGLPLEAWYPYMDPRVLDYLLSLPVVPWCDNKGLLRVAMRGRLPQAVLKRPKTPQPPAALSGLMARQADMRRLLMTMSELTPYVDMDKVMSAAPPVPLTSWLHFPVPVALLNVGYWLRSVT